MSIEQTVTEIEDSIDTHDVVSVVHAVDDLGRLLRIAEGPDAVPVLRALCRWSDRLDKHDDLAAYAGRLQAAPDAGPLDRLWARYWSARARWFLDDVDPDDVFGEMLSTIDADHTAEATALGNRLWTRSLAETSDIAVLQRYIGWARRRFAEALPSDRWLIVDRIHDGVLALDDQATGIPLLVEPLAWPDLDVELRRMLRGRLAAALRDDGDAAAARTQFLILADEAGEEPASLDLEMSSRMQAARLGAQAGASDAAIADLEQVIARASPITESDVEIVLFGRLTLTEILLEHRPADGERAALALWREFGDRPSDTHARIAGLALARSWAESDPTTTIERATAIVDRFDTVDDPDVRTLVVMALNSRTRALAESGDAARAASDAERAAELAESGVPDFVRDTARHNQQALRLRRGDYADRDEIYGVARQLGDEADAASSRGERDESARLYERAFEMTRLSDDAKTRLVGLAALRGWTFDLLADGAHAQAADVARRSIESGIDDGEVGSELLAQAWLHFGIATNRLSDRASALYAFAQVEVVARDRRDAGMSEIASQAAWNTAVLLDDGNDPDGALRAYAGVVDRLSAARSTADQRRVAKALKNSAMILGEEMNRPLEAGTAWAQLIERYDGNPDAELTRLVDEARRHAPPSKSRGFWRRNR